MTSNLVFLLKKKKLKCRQKKNLKVLFFFTKIIALNYLCICSDLMSISEYVGPRYREPDVSEH